MGFCASESVSVVEVFGHVNSGGPFPSRQNAESREALARLYSVDPARTLFVRQFGEAIAAGAFHNDVVAFANENVLFAHEQAFADKEDFYADLRRLLPGVDIIEVPGSEIGRAHV